MLKQIYYCFPYFSSGYLLQKGNRLTALTDNLFQLFKKSGTRGCILKFGQPFFLIFHAFTKITQLPGRFPLQNLFRRLLADNGLTEFLITFLNLLRAFRCHD